MNVPAILQVLETCPGLIAFQLTDGKGHYCVLGWLAVQAGASADLLWGFPHEGMRARFGLTTDADDPDRHALVACNNLNYRSREARLEGVRAYLKEQQDG